MVREARTRSAFAWAVAVGTCLQVGMVTAGHFSTAVAQLFPLLGVSISFLAGLLYASRVPEPTPAGAALGGALAGGLCAFLGIAVSVLLGDVLPVLLAFGTASSAVGGLLGGLLGRRFAARRAVGAL